MKYGKKSKDKRQDRKIAQLYKWISPELKNFSAVHATDSIPGQSTNALVVTNIANPAQGTAANQRIGNSISVHGIELRGSALNPGTATSQLQFIRIMIIHDKRYNGTDPTGAELLNGYNVTDVSMANAYSTVNTNFVANRLSGKSGQIRVLYDNTCYLPSNLVTTSGCATQLQCPFYFRKMYKKPLKVGFEGSTSEAGQIFIVVFPGSDTTGNSNPFYGWNTMVKYTDD